MEELIKCTTDEEKKVLVETRHTILRLPPLLLALIGYSTVRLPGGIGRDNSKGVKDTVKLLLEHGARCDARDLCGKTIVHYAAGPLCTPSDNTVLELADMCIQKAKEHP